MKNKFVEIWKAHWKNSGWIYLLWLGVSAVLIVALFYRVEELQHLPLIYVAWIMLTLPFTLLITILHAYGKTRVSKSTEYKQETKPNT